MSIEYNEVGFLNAYNINVERRIQAIYVIEVFRNNEFVRCSATHWNGVRSKSIEAGEALQNIEDNERAYKHRVEMLNHLKNHIERMTIDEVSDFEDDESWSKIGIKVAIN